MANSHEKTADKAKKRRRRIRQIRGMLFTLFAVIGIVTVVTGGVRILRERLNPADDLEEYTALISPLVVLNPIPFESVDAANPDVLVESAIWAVMLQEDTEKFIRNEYEQLMIPTVEVDRYFSKMYGEESLPEHATIVDSDLTYAYDAATETYIIPITSMPVSYFPQITAVQRSGNQRILTVSYMQQNQTGASISIDPTTSQDDVRVVKEMIYELQRDGRDYHIVAVREPVTEGE